ncbi:hypothetical protein BX616_008250, partial [Lobosporangium transversale]
MRPEKNDTIRSFAQRLLPLVEAAGIPDDGCYMLIKALCNHLSDVGFQAVIKEFGSVKSVSSLKEFLEFLEKTPGALGEKRTDDAHWFIQKYGGDAGEQYLRSIKSRSEYTPREVPRSSHKRSRLNANPSSDREAKKAKPFKVWCKGTEKCRSNPYKHAPEDCRYAKDQVRDHSKDKPKDVKRTDVRKPLASVSAFKRISD